MAITALHSGKLLDAKFSDFSNYFPNNARNTSNSQATAKDPRSFHVNITDEGLNRIDIK